MATVAMTPTDRPDVKVESKPTLTPPASEEADKHDESSSDLSDLELDTEGSAEILPDHYYDNGKIPVFKPTMDQFKSFKIFISKIDHYGMKSGIVKVIPPKEWREKLPDLDERVKTIKVKNPITQEFHGTHGTYTQANIEKQRSYNLPQWKAVSEESNHQPPARRGERRRNQEKVTRGGTARALKKEPVLLPDGKKRGPGRPRIRPLPTTLHKREDEGDTNPDIKVQVPPTPTSPAIKPIKVKKEALSDGEESSPSKPKGRQPKSVSSRRKHNSRDQGEVVDEEAFKGFDYRVHNQSEWTTERCQELETAYWKSLTFNNPMYGADMPGSLFDDSTEDWNVAKLENLLDVLGQKIPGVNTAYLYLGMWKATFAWHLEDVDLYSINYIHFGAPKQWYSISQEDARRFEAAMRNVWPNDAKNCDQFLRHKTYLISPQLLQSQYNIKVNRLVHNEGEFVITFPYGYHSGYNLGYNCAESVNFATEAWLDYGRVAKKCNCEADSVWVDVEDIERKLRGEQTPEYYEETDDEDDEEEGEEEAPTDLPTPPGSDKGKPKVRSYKRKRDQADKDAKPKIKRLRIKLSAPNKEPCVLCPNDSPFEVLLPTDNGLKAHRRCGLYTPETYLAVENGVERVCDISRIDKARLELKCNYCRNKRGAVFQCSAKKCTRAYHATCAASAGVQVDIGLVPVFGEDGTEYIDTGIDFRCRFHRSKKPKFTDKEHCSLTLEENVLIRKYAKKLSRGEVVQVQYFQGDIFAGAVLENRKSEQTLLIEVLPKGDTIEVEYKWLLVFDPADSLLPIPSENAKPLPAHLARKSQTTTEDPSNEYPKPDDPFCDAGNQYTWAEFHTAKIARNAEQVAIDFSKEKKLWFYIGKTSTEAKPHYTADLTIMLNDPMSNFLDSVKPALVAVPPKNRSYPASYPTVNGVSTNASNLVRTTMHPHIQARPPLPMLQPQQQQKVQDRPYNGKYAIKEPIQQRVNPEFINMRIDQQPMLTQRQFLQSASAQPSVPYQSHMFQTPAAPMRSIAPALPTMEEVQRRQSSPQLNNMGNFRRWNQMNQQSQVQPPLNIQPQPPAPVANMMTSTISPSSSGNPFSRPLSMSKLSSPVVPQPSSGRTRAESLTAVKNYPYLYQAALERDPVYRSPYAPGGGFTEHCYKEGWVTTPKPAQARHSRTKSLSQDFFMQRTPSQQDHLKRNCHVRQVSAEKALLQQQQQEKQLRRQREEKQRAVMPPPPPSHDLLHHQHIQPHLTHAQDFHPPQYQPHIPFNRSHSFSDFPNHFGPPSRSFSDPLLSDPLLSDPLLPDRHQPLHLAPPFEPQGLQFQTQRDFQMQMQRDIRSTQPQPTKSLVSFDPWLGDMRPVGHVHPSPHEDQEIGEGESGSPLRRGMRAAGGEMLPMMGTQF